jgi:hypothetical protein
MRCEKEHLTRQTQHSVFSRGRLFDVSAYRSRCEPQANARSPLLKNVRVGFIFHPPYLRMSPTRGDDGSMPGNSLMHHACSAASVSPCDTMEAESLRSAIWKNPNTWRSSI